jgi:hypothetical protein
MGKSGRLLLARAPVREEDVPFLIIIIMKPRRSETPSSCRALLPSLPLSFLQSGAGQLEQLIEVGLPNR